MPSSKNSSVSGLNASCPSDLKLEVSGNCTPGRFECPTNMNSRPKRGKTKESVRDYILFLLGAPTIRVEIDEQAIDFAIEQAMRVFEEWAPRDLTRYYVFQTNPGQSVYEMPAEIGFIRNVYYRRLSSPNTTSVDNGSIPLEFMYGSYTTFGFLNPTFPVWGSTGEWTLYKQYEQMYNRVSSAIGGFEILANNDDDNIIVKIYPIPCATQQVIVQYIQSCMDHGRQSLLAIQEGALAYCMIALGNIWSKYGNQPGPGGGPGLNGAIMLQNGQQKLQEWEEKIMKRYGEFCPVYVG